MYSLAANITHLWANLPIFDRFDAAAEAGFTAVEVNFPYDEPVPELQAALRRNKLEFISLNAPPPNYTGGERGYAAVPGRQARFKQDIRRTFRYASALRARFVHIMAGNARGPDAEATFLANLQLASAAAPEGLILLIEPISQQSAPNYFLNSFEQAVDLIDRARAPNLGLLFDSSHAQEITGDAVATFEAVSQHVRHIQIGDAPGNVAPGLGTIDFRALARAIRDSGYSGYISGEYKVDSRTEDTLAWLKDLKAA